MNAEPVYVDEDSEQSLDDSDEQDDHVSPAFEESQAQAPDDESRDERQQDEAADVVAERDVAAADRSRGEEVAQEADDEEGDPEPGATLISQNLLTSAA